MPMVMAVVTSPQKTSVLPIRIGDAAVVNDLAVNACGDHSSCSNRSQALRARKEGSI